MLHVAWPESLALLRECLYVRRHIWRQSACHRFEGIEPVTRKTEHRWDTINMERCCKNGIPNHFHIPVLATRQYRPIRASDRLSAGFKCGRLWAVSIAVLISREMCSWPAIVEWDSALHKCGDPGSHRPTSFCRYGHSGAEERQAGTIGTELWQRIPPQV